MMDKVDGICTTKQGVGSASDSCVLTTDAFISKFGLSRSYYLAQSLYKLDQLGSNSDKLMH